MKAMLARTKKFIKSEDGPTTVEYAVMLALIIAVAIGTIGVLGGKVNDAIKSVEVAMP